MKPSYCRKSPTRAHHWMFEPQGIGNENRATCKYCEKERRFTHESPYGEFGKGDIHADALGRPRGWHHRIVKGEKV